MNDEEMISLGGGPKIPVSQLRQAWHESFGSPKAIELFSLACMLDDTTSLLGRIKELAPHNLRSLRELFIHSRPIELDTDNTVHKGYLDALNKIEAELEFRAENPRA